MYTLSHRTRNILITLSLTQLSHLTTQVERVREREGRGVQWMRTREASHGWMQLVLRSWREVSEEGRARTRNVVQRPERVTEEQRELKLARVRGANGGGVYAEKIRSGNRRGQTLVATQELWWRRLRDKVRAVGTWGRVVSVSARARARWRRACAKARDEVRKRKRTEARAASGDATKGAARQVATKWSTRVGVRLRWWIEDARGSDAGGPMSESAGVAARQPLTSEGEARRRQWEPGGREGHPH